MADLIVISKTDIADAAMYAQTLACLRAINPGAECIEVIAGDIACEKIFGRGLFDPASRIDTVESWLALHRTHAHDHEQSHTHGDEYKTHHIVSEGTLSLAGTSVFLNHVVNEQRDRILRIKGLAGFRERDGAPAVLHAVQDKFYPINWLTRWPSADHSSRFVFIGRELDTAALDRKFSSLCV
jgi:G3E family GTPase